MSVYSLQSSDLEKLDQHKAVVFFRRLLWAEASRVGLSRSLIDAPECINVGDGGLDAVIQNAAPIIDDVIPLGFSGFQIKASDLQPQKCKKEMHQQQRLNAPLKPEIKRLFDNNGTYILVLFKDITGLMKRRREKAIREEITNNGYTNPKIRVFSANQLAGFAERHTSLIVSLKEYLGSGIPHSKWSENTDIRSPKTFVKDQQRSTIMDEIRTGIRNRDASTPVYRISGLSGLGKTRLAFETLSPDDLSNRVVYLRADVFRNSTLFQHLINDDSSNAIIVADECSLADHEYFVRHLSGRSPRLALITISSEIGRVTNPSFQYQLEKLPHDEIKRLISKESAGLPPEVMERLVNFADGYPRIAMLLIEKYNRYPQSREDLLTINDESLLNNLIAGGIGTGTDLFNKIKRVLMGLSLFEKVGYKGSSSGEAKWLASFIGVNWTEFQEIVRSQKKRGIIQGEYYIYVTPFLLAVYLLREWWASFGTDTTLEELINGIPPDFRQDMTERLTSRLPYIGTIEAGRNLIRTLLSENGIFSSGDFLENKVGSTMFLRLTEADPELALLSLKRTVGTWSKERLLRFTTGRREVIYSLQKIAVWKNYFADAARLLLALAEAENESYANNASGEFADLFTPAWGQLAPTEALPTERFPVLVEALNSESIDRKKLALKASRKALQYGHFFRWVGAENQGPRAPPKLWTPKTYEEIFAYYRLVWEYISENLEKIAMEIRNEAVGVLLDSARGVTSINNPSLSEMVISTIGKMSKYSWVDKTKLIEAVSQITHYDGKRMPEDIQKKWFALRDELIGGSFGGLLLRFVGMYLVQDYFQASDKYNTQWIDTKIFELAEQAKREPELLESEYEWLTTAKAKRGHQFGYELGKLDKGFTLLRRLVKEQEKAGSNGNASFLGGYLRAVFEKDVKLWEEELDSLSATALKAFVPELTWRSGITERAIVRLISMIEKGDVTVESLGIFTFGGVAQKIPESVFFNFVKFFMAQKASSGATIALELMQFRYHESNVALNKEFTSELLLHPAFWSGDKKNMNDRIIYSWNEMADMLIVQYPETEELLAKRIIEFFGDERAVTVGIHSQTHELLARIVKKDPEKYWNLISKYLGPPTSVRSFYLTSWLRGDNDFPEKGKSALELFSPESIWKWVEQDEGERARYLATFVTPHLFMSDEKICLARELLVRYGDKQEVRNNLRGNFFTEGWTGPASLHYLAKKNELLNYKKSETNSNVILWITEFIEILDRNIESAKASEEREGYYTK